MITTSLQLLKDVHRHCQRKFKYIPEGKNRDHWKTPVDFILDGGGDCEDWAIYAYDLLKTAEGVDPRTIRLARVRTGAEYKEAHTVLVVKCDDGAEYVSDNRMLIPIPLEDIHADHLGDWQMLVVWMFNESGLWVKGKLYRGTYPAKWKAFMSEFY